LDQHHATLLAALKDCLSLLEGYWFPFTEGVPNDPEIRACAASSILKGNCTLDVTCVHVPICVSPFRIIDKPLHGFADDADAVDINLRTLETLAASALEFLCRQKDIKQAIISLEKLSSVESAFHLLRV